MNVDELHDYYLKASSGEKERLVKLLLSEEQPRVVYGARSVNVRLPDYLQGPTEDWDIYCHDAEETARKLEQMLDKEFGGDYFDVKPAKHPRTYRVFSKVTNNVVADITLPDKAITYQNLDGIKYATLDEQVTNIKRILTEPESRFRWAKDAEVLQRIKLFRQKYPGVEKRPVHKLSRKENEPGISTVR